MSTILIITISILGYIIIGCIKKALLVRARRLHPLEINYSTEAENIMSIVWIIFTPLIAIVYVTLKIYELISKVIK